MIKINLNKTKVDKDHHTLSFQETQETGLAASGSTIATKIFDSLKVGTAEVSSGDIIKILIKLLIMASFPLGLKYYEITQIKELENKKQKSDQLLTQSNQRLSEIKKKLDTYGDLQNLSKEFVEKKDFLKKISASRLVVPRTLDLIQAKLPESVWLKTIKITLSDDDETHSISISGEGYKESNVNFFAISLKEILNKNTITVDTNDIKDGSSDSILKVQFDLKGTM